MESSWSTPMSGEAGDRISALPDDVLLDIVRHLDLRTTVTVGALSRRWRRIPRSLSDLRIDVYDLIPHDGDAYSPTLHTVDKVMTAYTAAARWLLSSSSSSPSGERTVIKTISLGFYLTNPYLRSVGRAVEDVVRSGRTERLSFKIWVDGEPDDGRAVIADGDDDGDEEDFCPELRVAFGQRLMSFFHACSTAFSWLTNLTLSYLCFGDEDLPTLLNTCHRLEFLSLRSCDFGDDDTTALKIDAPRSQLLELELRFCEFQSVELLRVPKLVRVVSTDYWQRDGPSVQFGYVPCLDNVSIGFQCDDWQEPLLVLSVWLSNARNLTTMCLDFNDLKVWVQPEDPKQLAPVFSNLRDLYIHGMSHECDLYWTLSVLESAPFLKTFYISICHHICDLRKQEYIDGKTNLPRETFQFEHHNLSLVQIEGFAIEKKMMQYIRLIIKRGVCLKKISLLEELPCEDCDLVKVGNPSLTSPKFPVHERNRKLVRERLTDGLSSSVEISIGR